MSAKTENYEIVVFLLPLLNNPPMLSAEPALSPPTTVAGLGIEIAGVRHVFPGGVEAIRRLDLSIVSGEFVALLGPSGCGKSTLLRLIAGLDRPTEGTATTAVPTPGATVSGSSTNGVAHPTSPRVPAINAHAKLAPREATFDIACVFQDANLLPWRTVLQNAALPLELQGAPKQARLDAARLALAWVGLDGFADRYPNQLSGGMRMRVSIARALTTRPRLLLMDEPFAALDEITRQRLDELLRRLWAESGMTVLFVTHSTQEATFLANRAVVMSARPGRIVLDHPIELPHDRPAMIRGEPAFAAQTRLIFQALETGEGAAQ